MPIAAIVTSTVQSCLRVWESSFVVSNGSARKRSKVGKACGKPIPESQLAGFLNDNVPAYKSCDTETQLEVLQSLLALGTEDPTGEGEDSYMEEVDPWIVPLLMCFRWRSDGAAVRGFYHKALANHIAKGGDFDGTGVIRELVPMEAGNENCLSTALMADPRIWVAFEEAYRKAVQDPLIRVTPKTSKDGVKFYWSFRGYLKIMLPAWLSDIRFHIPEEPKTIANKPDLWSFWHFGPYTHPSLLEKPGPTPAWDGWLAKLGHNDRSRVFLAWLFGTCMARNRSRQILWMEGRGGDGKGAVTAAIMAFLGERAAFPINEDVFSNTHGTAALYGHRLLVHPDCKNPRFLSYATVHQITGGDRVFMNPKFGQAFSERMDARIMVLANCPPDMDVYNMHEASRMLYLYINPMARGADKSHLVVSRNGQVQLKGDTGFEAKLLAEMPSLLARAAVDYQALCPSHGNVILPDTVVNDISDRCASIEQERFEKFYDDNFDVDEGAWVETSLVKETFERMMPNGSKGNVQYQSFVKFLEAHGHRKVRPTTTDGSRVRGFYGIKPKGAPGQRLSEVNLHRGHVGIDDKEAYATEGSEDPASAGIGIGGSAYGGNSATTTEVRPKV